jgi:glycosyltransferase involved in cell wall biosynthesis
VSSRLVGPSMLALVGDMTGPSLWRVLQPFTALENLGYPCGWDETRNRLVSAVAPGFDGYLLPRLSWPDGPPRRQAERWFRAARAAGKLTVYDLDDDLLSMSTIARRLALEPERTLAELEADRAAIVWAVGQVDGVTVSTPRLAEVVRRFTDAPVLVVPNAIGVRWFRSVLRATRRQIPPLTIGWSGGQRPDADLAPMAEAWRLVAARFRDVRFVVSGSAMAVLCSAVPVDRLHLRPWVPIERYPASFVDVDISCCAVEPSPFNAAKSPIKAMESAIAGCAVVASPFVYGELVEHGRSGYLAETAGDWYAALAELASRPSHRAMLARRLERRVERDCSLTENLWRWPQAWAAIAADARARRGRLVAM